jgi:hypothetical protein
MSVAGKLFHSLRLGQHGGGFAARWRWWWCERRQFGRFACGSTPACGSEVRAFGPGISFWGVLTWGCAPGWYMSGRWPFWVLRGRREASRAGLQSAGVLFCPCLYNFFGLLLL